MALSQNVVVNFLTKFDKKGLDRATKELKGFDKFVVRVIGEVGYFVQFRAGEGHRIIV